MSTSAAAGPTFSRWTARPGGGGYGVASLGFGIQVHADAARWASLTAARRSASRHLGSSRGAHKLALACRAACPARTACRARRAGARGTRQRRGGCVQVSQQPPEEQVGAPQLAPVWKNALAWGHVHERVCQRAPRLGCPPRCRGTSVSVSATVRTCLPCRLRCSSRACTLCTLGPAPHAPTAAALQVRYQVVNAVEDRALVSARLGPAARSGSPAQWEPTVGAAAQGPAACAAHTAGSALCGDGHVSGTRLHAPDTSAASGAGALRAPPAAAHSAHGGPALQQLLPGRPAVDGLRPSDRPAVSASGGPQAHDPAPAGPQRAQRGPCAHSHAAWGTTAQFCTRDSLHRGRAAHRPDVARAAAGKLQVLFRDSRASHRMQGCRGAQPQGLT